MKAKLREAVWYSCFSVNFSVYNRIDLSKGHISFQSQILAYPIHGNSLIPCKPVHTVITQIKPLKIHVPGPQTT